MSLRSHTEGLGQVAPGPGWDGQAQTILQPKRVKRGDWHSGSPTHFYRGQKYCSGSYTDTKIVMDWSTESYNHKVNSNRASDKLNMGFCSMSWCWISPLPSSKAAPGAAEMRVGHSPANRHSPRHDHAPLAQDRLPSTMHRNPVEL